MSKYGDKPKDDVWDILTGLEMEYGLSTILEVVLDYINSRILKFLEKR